jgi:hypothetical protein
MLLARPKINDEECLVSYLIQVAENNGFKNIGHLLHYADLGWKNNHAPVYQILSGKFDITSLLLNFGLTEYRSLTTPTCNTFQCVIDTHHILVSHPKVCPECLEELGYCRYQWAFLPVVACFKHKKMLIDVSSVSGKQLSWYRQHSYQFDDEDQHIKPSLMDAAPA